MSIHFFEHSNTQASPRLPFVEDYAENNPDDQTLYLVEEVKRTRKRTGYMVYTRKFAIFLFEDSQICKHIVEALAAWTKTGNGFELYAQSVPKDPYYRLGADFEKPCTWLFSQGKYSASQVDTSGLVVLPTETNPFLPTPSGKRATRHKTHPTNE
jgi:hypothetical protein